MNEGSELDRLRARQMIEITEGGPIPFEVPELTRAILREAWFDTNGKIEFCLLSGDTITS